jgi:PII-like signaling protein
MQGSFLRFYVHEGQRHQGRLLWEWLLIQANERGIHGGSAFKAMAGFGRHHKLCEARFVELAGSLLSLLHEEKISVFYACISARFGVIDPSTQKPPSVAAGD